MQIVLRGAAAGYEAEHTARIFYPAAELSQTLPDDTADLVLAVAHRYLLLVLVRQNGTTTWVQQRPPQGDARTQEYALCRMLYTMLCGVTGIRPPWGMMTGVRPVRIIHDLRAEGKTEEEIEQRRRAIDHDSYEPSSPQDVPVLWTYRELSQQPSTDEGNKVIRFPSSRPPEN